MNLETFGQVVGRFHKHLDKCGRKAGESWRKLGKAGGSNICAFRSPARSGLIPPGKQPPATRVKIFRRSKNFGESEIFWTYRPLDKSI